MRPGFVSFLTCLVIGIAAPALAEDKRAQAEQAYARVLASPGDYDANVRYSALKAQQGDYEAAIPPLERLLVNDSTNAWLQLQLAILYRALGSNVMSAQYARMVETNPHAAAELKQKAAAMHGGRKG